MEIKVDDQGKIHLLGTTVKKIKSSFPKHSILNAESKLRSNRITINATTAIHFPATTLPPGIPWIGGMVIEDGWKEKLTHVYRFDIDFAKKAPSKKQKKPPKIPRDLLDEFVQFGERSNDKLPTSQKTKLGKWADVMKKDCESLYVAVQSGFVKLTVYGHASSEGTKRANERVSAERAKSVIHALKQRPLFGRKVDAISSPKAAQHALNRKGGDRDDRRAVIIIEKNDAVNGIKKQAAIK